MFCSIAVKVLVRGGKIVKTDSGHTGWVYVDIIWFLFLCFQLERIIGGSYGYESDIWSLGLVYWNVQLVIFHSPPQPGEGWVNVYELMETIVGQAPPRAPADQFSPQFCSFIEAW